jgi:hypothetical protein
MKRITLLAMAVLTSSLMLVGAKPALAVNDFCDFVTTECEVTTIHNVSGTFTIDRTLHIFGTGKLDASGGGITINITGDLLMDTGASIEANDDAGAACNSGPDRDNACPITINATGNMEMQAGSSILAENNCVGGGPCGGGSGGNITIKLGGDMILHGPATGALISSRKTSGAGDTGHGGDIYIQVGNVVVSQTTGPNGEPIFTGACADKDPTGDILVEQGAQILADANGEAGAIRMFAGHDITIRGTVSSRGFTTLGRGGPITLYACCNLLIDDTGIVSSRGQDPGADLVHLEGCCVFINGLVESTGPGHFKNQTSPANNLCNDPVRPGKPTNSTGCVEIWSGTELEINSVLPHRGEINANTDFGGGADGTGWIDILANHDIRILDGTGNDQDFGATLVFAVHANQGSGDGCHGGVINVQSKMGMVTANGLALQAEAIGASHCRGGQITVEGDTAVTLAGASLFARGGHWNRVPPATSVDGTGGKIFVTTFGGVLNWNTGGVGDARPTGSIVAAAQDGKITLKNCTGAVNIVTTGSTFPTNGSAEPPWPIKLGGPCVPANPVFPQPAEPGGLLPDIRSDACKDACTPTVPPAGKFGIKFLDADKDGVQDPGEGGIGGFRIHLFNSDLSEHLHAFTTGGTGLYSFPNLPAGQYNVCEESTSGFTQSFPSPTSSPPSNQNPATACTDHAAAHGGTITMGTEGYFISLLAGDLDGPNNFGNFPNFCEKLPVRTVLDPTFGRFPDNHGPDILVNLALGDSVQAAIDKLTLLGDQNDDGYLIIVVVKDGSGKLGGSTKERIEISGQYEIPFALIGCSVTLIDPKPADNKPTAHVTKDASSPDFFFMDLHGSGSPVAGWLVEGNGRYVRNTGVSNNAVGIELIGDGNTMHNGSAHDNLGVGMYIQGNGNLATDTDVNANGGDGVQVIGDSNQLLKLDVGNDNGNTGNGVVVTGNLNLLSEIDAFKNGGNGIWVGGNSNQILKARAGEAKKGNGFDGIHVVGSGNILQENKASANGLDGYDISGGVLGSPNSLKKNLSNTGSSNSSSENGGAEYRLLNYIKNNGENKDDGTTLPNAGKCPAVNAPPLTGFPATNATVNFSLGALVCE